MMGYLFCFLLLGISITIPILISVCVAHILLRKFPDISRYSSENYFPKVDRDGDLGEFSCILTDNSRKYLSLIIPAYNEEKRLPSMLDETISFLEDKKGPWNDYEIIVVNDGSKDKTSQVVLDYVSRFGSNKIRLLELKCNRGKGGALRLGFLSARGERLLFADADGATRFSDFENINKAMDKLLYSGGTCAVVCGSRSEQQDVVVKRSFIRLFLMQGFHAIVWLFCVRGVSDTQCGFKMLSRDAAKILFTNLHVERWAFDVELLYIAQRKGMPIREVPVNWEEKDGSKMVPLWSMLQMARDVALIVYCYFFNIWSLRTSEEALLDMQKCQRLKD